MVQALSRLVQGGGMSPAVEILDQETIRRRVAELGTIISSDYQQRIPILVAVMTGAMWFVSDLLKSITSDVEVDFLALNRFGEGGRIRIATDCETSLVERDVILVEDIVDTGLSLTVLQRLISDRQPRSLTTAALLDKTHRRLVDVELTYRGFEVGDEFLIGYGLDHRGRYRNLPSIWAVLDIEALETDPDGIARTVFPAS
jgi:hypoxanthine phosphoribosyltransferase